MSSAATASPSSSEVPAVGGGSVIGASLRFAIGSITMGLLVTFPEADFRKDQEGGNHQWHSEFLHVCLMAMGSRFAGSAWPGRRKVISGERETLVHKKAKEIFESGGEKLSGLPMVQALLILGDMECGVGRLESGWMYASM
jgi:hypothetical protein